MSAALAAVAATAEGGRYGAVRRYAGLDAALAFELQLADAAGQQVDAAVRQAGQLADVMQQVADGAGRLGESRAEHRRRRGAGTRCRARSGARRRRRRPASSSMPSPAERSRCCQRAASCSTRAVRARRATAVPAAAGPGAASTRIGTVRDQLRSGVARSSRSALCTRDRTGFTGFFRSGYLMAAGLEGARPEQREAIAGLVDSANGGRKARILVMPDVPTNDPRQDHIVDEVRGSHIASSARPASPRR